MEFIAGIQKKLNEEHFSFELLNYCKDEFQYGGFNDDDKEKFKLLFSENIKKTLPNLTQEQIMQIAQVCIDRGILNTKDILFLDGAAFSLKIDDSFGIIKKYVDFIWLSKEYKWCDFLDITFFFTNPKLTKKDQSFLNRLRFELNEIFVQYYNITTFPEKLGLNFATAQSLAIKYNKEEIINGLNNNLPFSITIICNIGGTSEILLTELTYEPYGKKLISITKMVKNSVKLSEMIKEKNKQMIKM